MDGTATKGEDYVDLKRTMIFEPNESILHLDVEIIDDDEWEMDEVFFVRIIIEDDQNGNVVLGEQAINQVTIINDDGKQLAN